MKHAAMIIITTLLTWNLTPAQIQIGTVRGVVTDAGGAIVADARVTLVNPLTRFRAVATTNQQGAFEFNNIPFARYDLKVEADHFQTATQNLSVRSNLPLRIEIKLAIAGAQETINVTSTEGLLERDSSSTQTTVDESFIARAEGAAPNRNLQNIIATTAGWTTQNNGLLHIRGVDDGILYVVDGVPTVDRVDTVFAGSPDVEMIRSLEIITGNIPAEFGGRSGAVVVVQPKSAIDLNHLFSLGFRRSGFATSELEAMAASGFRKKLGFFFSLSANQSNRFLDPVDERNFHNHGDALQANLRGDWHPTPKDILLFDTAVAFTHFDVPNQQEQEIAGQRQKQSLHDNSFSVSWQRVWSASTVTNLAGYRRFYESALQGSPFDTPVFAEQERHHSRYGLLASATHTRAGHTVKAGLEAMRIAPHEFFTFAITDDQVAAENGVSDAARRFDIHNPFLFRDSQVGHSFAAYVQDQFSPVRNLTVNAGLRYDLYKLQVQDAQFSPRIGAVYFFPKTRTALRASFNRLFMPPQVENLLLAGSEQARALSPFVTESGGGALIHAERASAYEAGLAQDIFGYCKLDVAYWHRNFRNFDDPNVFFNTTVIFPNSVAKGFARGLDVRLDVPERQGWSGYLSYTNQRILQTGPLNGGLFLTDEFITIAPGVKFIPDHDQRNVAAGGVMYEHRRSGAWASISGRYESGIPLEVDEDNLAALQGARGADLVNFARRRVKPYTIFNFAAGIDLFRQEHTTLSLQIEARNFTNKRFAYNFGNPFEGTHFGQSRIWGSKLQLTFH